MWNVLGVAVSSMWISMGGPDMDGRGLWGHVLNVDFEYLFSSQLLILLLFSGIGSNGSSVGFGGTDSRIGHRQLSESLTSAQPELMLLIM